MDTNRLALQQNGVTNSSLRMIIASEVGFLRESLAEIFEREPSSDVLGTCGDLPSAVAMCAAFAPDIVLLDAAFPGGIGVVGEIRAASPASRVVALALTENEESVIAWAEAGAAGYVPNTAGLADLGAMLADIAQGAQACSARVASGLLRRIAQSAVRVPGRAPEMPALTARERQIVGMISAGMSNKDIARELNIGLATTKSHVHNLLGKLSVRRRSQAAFWMRQHGAL